jgi:hypothetical protein
MIRQIFVAMVGTMLLWAQDSSAQGPVEVYGEAALHSRYVDEDVIVYTPGPAFQPNLGVQYEGCFADVWANIGLTYSAGDEVDFTIGCEREVAENVTINVSVAHYEFLSAGESMLAVSGGVSYHNFTLQASYFRPNTKDEAVAFRLTGVYTYEIDQAWSVEGKMTFDSGAYTDVPSVVAIGATVKYALTPSLNLSATGLVPVWKSERDERPAQAFASLTWSF